MTFGFFECKFCETRFVNEKRFKKHRCDLMERYEFVTTTPRGRFSYKVYVRWMKVRGFVKPSKEMFIESRYYSSILKFVDFYYSMMLPDVDDYIAYVTEGEFLPQMWTNGTVYERYLTAFDTRVSPEQQAEITFKYLRVLMRMVQTDDMKEVFQYVYPDELAKLIQSRRLSPWVLLNCISFHRYMESMDEGMVPVLESMVCPELWTPRFKENKKAVKTIKGMVKACGI